MGLRKSSHVLLNEVDDVHDDDDDVVGQYSAAQESWRGFESAGLKLKMRSVQGSASMICCECGFGGIATSCEEWLEKEVVEPLTEVPRSLEELAGLIVLPYLMRPANSVQADRGAKYLGTLFVGVRKEGGGRGRETKGWLRAPYAWHQGMSRASDQTRLQVARLNRWWKQARGVSRQTAKSPNEILSVSKSVISRLAGNDKLAEDFAFRAAGPFLFLQGSLSTIVPAVLAYRLSGDLPYLRRSKVCRDRRFRRRKSQLIPLMIGHNTPELTEEGSTKVLP
ncbi:uncharacterized protein BDZ83DRAFT_760658 [Colletotrichum acutatum]|uniref:Uncharacterized protein n=1 Tax=Glomerella acutata TaxID=27357 RepID=A0AAD8UGF5_GLOAC|nr:uncharacterized protein BDZ83DRAFT_760658 [Colletotrichum acutatum]KAK1717387.1 hypothetical protein BDZ83DRAFT_760658 [Colletotrichum acutatum]